MALENRTRSGYRNESESESESVREGLDWVPLYRICSIYCGGGRGKTLAYGTVVEYILNQKNFALSM